MNLCIFVGYGKDNVDKATISLTLARAALESGEGVSVILVSEGVNLSVKGYSEGMDNGAPFDPIQSLIEEIHSKGAKLSVCTPCLKNRGVNDEDILPEFARIAGPDVIRNLKESDRSIQL